MLPLVEFCMMNLMKGSQEVYNTLMDRDDVDVMFADCLSECTLCEQELYCFFEGDIISADNPGDLLSQIEDEITEWHNDMI